MRRFGLAVAAVGLAGCFAPPPAPRSFALAVSPDFTRGDTQAVWIAAAQWQAAIPEITWSEADTCQQTDTSVQLVCVSLGTDSSLQSSGSVPADLMGDTATADDGSKQVTLYVASIEAVGLDVQRIALHELGHSMWLVHHATGTVMDPWANTMATAPTADDIAQWRARP